MTSPASARVRPLSIPEREVGGQLRRLAVGDERADRDEAAVARRKIGSQP